MGRLLSLVLLLTALVLAAPLQAQQSTPRAASHDGFGRMVFDFSPAVRWSADATDKELVVRFDSPIAGDPKVLLKPLSKYLRGVTVSADKRTATFALAVPVQIKAFLTGNSVVIDLREGKPPAAAQPQQPQQAAAAPPPPAPAPAPAPPPAAVPAPPAAPAPAPAPPAAAPAPAMEPPADVAVRGGEHTGFNRLVFDWAKPVGYAVEATGGQAVIAFDRPARIKAEQLRQELPADVSLIDIRQTGKGTQVVLGLSPEMRVRHFTSGPKVALDLVRPAGAPPPPRAAGTQPPPLAPPPGAAEQPPALKPLLPPPQAQAKTDMPAAAAPAPAPAAPTAPALAPSPAAAPAAKGAAPKIVSLSFPWDQPAAAAVFRRAGWLWAVFDRQTEVDIKLLKRTGGTVVQQVEQIKGVKGTAVRLLTEPGYNPSIRKDGLLWVLDLHEQDMSPKVGIEFRPEFDFEDRGRLVLAVADAAAPILIKDPEVGDTVHVVPVLPPGAGVRGDREYPALEVLATAQGIAVVPKSDGVRLESSRAGVEISMPGGFYMSRDLPGSGSGSGVARPAVTGPLDIPAWLRGGADRFTGEHQKLLARLSTMKPEDRNQQRLEVARHYLANGFGAEALGVLRSMEHADPQVVDTPNFRAVRGGANFLMHRDAEAIEDLSFAGLEKDPVVGLWVSAARARLLGAQPRDVLSLRLANEDIRAYPPSLRMPIGREAVLAVAASGDEKAAKRVLEAMRGSGLNRRDMAALSYLAGRVSEAAKQYDSATNSYLEAEAGDSRPDRAFATRDRLELHLRLGKITEDDAIRELEKLRFAWRAGDFEYQLLKRLGQLQIAAGHYGAGLRTLRTLAANYAENPDSANVVAMMSAAFNRLYLDGEADKLSPITAIGLYDEFQELTPSGSQGDEMIRRLADRLASVDLLDRASELLRHQVTYRLKDVSKARIGARLAYLDLLDRRPKQALESLDVSEMPDLPDDLSSQRRYLRVQAMDELGRSADALALIINDQAEEAKRLRASIYWRQKKWPEAAAAIEATLEAPVPNRPMTPQSARRVLDLATAMTLAKDERGLQRLRRQYSGLMAATEFSEAFTLLVSEPEKGIVDYRRVGEKIKQVEDFQSFMTEWKARVKTEGLSSIN